MGYENFQKTKSTELEMVEMEGQEREKNGALNMAKSIMGKKHNGLHLDASLLNHFESHQ